MSADPQGLLPGRWCLLDGFFRIYGRHKLVVNEEPRWDGNLLGRGGDGDGYSSGHGVLVVDEDSGECERAVRRS